MSDRLTAEPGTLEKACVVCNKKLSGQQEKYCSTLCNRRATRQRHKKPCLDCGKLVHQESMRCFRCSRKALEKPMNYCLDCGKPILRKSERCYSCAAKMVGKNVEVRSQRSKTSKAIWQNPEYRHKQSEVLKAAHQRGAYTQETRRKQSEAAELRFQDPDERHRQSERQKAVWRQGIYDNPETRRKVSEGLKRAWAQGLFDHRCIPSPPFRSTEVPLSAALDICGIQHETHHRPTGCRYEYDELVLPNILIEAHGDYWHGNPSFFAEEDLDKRQRRHMARDPLKAAGAEANGYALIVMWEHEIKECGAWSLVHERVLPLLENT